MKCYVLYKSDLVYWLFSPRDFKFYKCRIEKSLPIGREIHISDKIQLDECTVVELSYGDYKETSRLIGSVSGREWKCETRFVCSKHFSHKTFHRRVGFSKEFGFIDISSIPDVICNTCYNCEITIVARNASLPVFAAKCALKTEIDKDLIKAMMDYEEELKHKSANVEARTHFVTPSNIPSNLRSESSFAPKNKTYNKDVLRNMNTVLKQSYTKMLVVDLFESRNENGFIGKVFTKLGLANLYTSVSEDGANVVGKFDWFYGITECINNILVVTKIGSICTNSYKSEIRDGNYYLWTTLEGNKLNPLGNLKLFTVTHPDIGKVAIPRNYKEMLSNKACEVELKFISPNDEFYKMNLSRQYIFWIVTSVTTKINTEKMITDIAFVAVRENDGYVLSVRNPSGRDIQYSSAFLPLEEAQEFNADVGDFLEVQIRSAPTSLYCNISVQKKLFNTPNQSLFVRAFNNHGEYGAVVDLRKPVLNICEPNGNRYAVFRSLDLQYVVASSTMKAGLFDDVTVDEMIANYCKDDDVTEKMLCFCQFVKGTFPRWIVDDSNKSDLIESYHWRITSIETPYDIYRFIHEHIQRL